MSGLDQTISGDQYTVTIKQTSQQALLNWQTFNVGRHTTLNFDQGAGGANVGAWIAFNKISDPLGRPSQILGSINTILGPNGKPGTGGQVYVINTNGIIFGGSSQVNTHALVASSLPVDNSAIAYLLNTQKTPVLFDGLSLPATTAIGDVEVQPGATLTAPTTAEHVGGLVALIGPNVYNGGHIQTPDGQTILAAGLQVGLVAHNANDPSLHGLDVYVGAVVDRSGNVTAASGTAGTVTNDMAPDGTMGLIEALRGDVTMVGQTVNQLGFINSSTSTAVNGRVDLLADYGAVSNPASLQFFLTQTGTVTLGPNSVTQILPDLTSPGNIGTQLGWSSMVNIQGQAIHLASSNGGPMTGAMILAPGAAIPSDPTKPAYGLGSLTSPLTSGVTLNAGSWYLDEPVTGLDSNAKGSFVNTNGQIYLDSGATIDVSGSQVENASPAENIVSVQLRGPQLANSPLQRAGLLRGQTINVDIRQFGNYNGQEWVGTPLADTTGYINLIQRSVDELTTAGGTVALNAGESVVMQSGSSINVSGGWIHYLRGVVQTTQVLSNGHFIDISKATPDLVFDGIYAGTFTTTDAKWGVTQTYTNPEFHNGAQYEPEYYQGGNGGSLSITAPAMALDGDLFGNTVAGSYQRTSATSIATTFAGSAALPTVQSVLGVPTPGALSLSFYGQQPVANPTNPSQFLIDDFVPYAPVPPEIRIERPEDVSVQSTPVLGTALPVARQNLVELSSALVDPKQNGFGLLSIDNSADDKTDSGTQSLADDQLHGKITVEKGVALVFSADSFLPLANGTLVNPALKLSAANIDIEGSITAPGGGLSFNVYDISPTWAQTLHDEGNISSSTLPIVNFDNARGKFILGKGATLSTAGLWVDDRASSVTAGSWPLATNGGQIFIQGSDVALGGSTLDVSGGVEVTAAGKPVYGSGGSLTINAGKDLTDSYVLGGMLTGITAVPASATSLELPAATLMGYAGSGKTGGVLSIQAPLIQVGGDTVLNGDITTTTKTAGKTLWLNETDSSGDLPIETDANGNSLPSDFFSRGGFSSFKLTGLGTADVGQASGFDPAVYIAPGTCLTPSLFKPTLIEPVVRNWQAAFDSSNQITLTPTLLPEGVRSAVNLNFAGASGIADPINNNLLTRGNVVMESGAVIKTEPQTNPANGVSLVGDTVAVLGSIQNSNGSITPGAQIIVPGGTITITGGSSNVFLKNRIGAWQQALPTVDLAPGSVLDASGTTLYTPDTSGRNLHVGTVFPGGTINVTGNIVAEGPVLDNNGNIKIKGATLDVSGASGVLDLSPTYSGMSASLNKSISGSTVVPTRVDSNGGNIYLTGTEELFTDATLVGAAGGLTATTPSMAAGGSLAISSGRFSFDTIIGGPVSTNSTDIALVVKSSGATIPTTYGKSGLDVIGAAVNPAVEVTVNLDATTVNGETGHFSANSFDIAYNSAGKVVKGGFDSLSLNVTGGAGAIQFFGQVKIIANNNLSVGNGGVIYADDAVTLKAPYVKLGASFSVPGQANPLSNKPQPLYGSGSLTVNATDLIDIGNLSLQNIGTATFDATNGGTRNGDIRGDGTLDVAGDIKMTAGQVYPPTAVPFTIIAYDKDPTVIVAESGQTDSLNLSSMYKVILASPVLPPGFGIGSSLLGSTVTAIDGTVVTLASAPNVTISNRSNIPEVLSSALNTGSVTISGGSSLAPPLSAGGTLSIYASKITQGGVLRAPIGTINLGWNDPGTAPTDPITGAGVPVSQTVTLAPDSVTSVSAAGLTIPYGINLNGTLWVDPTGTDITVKGNDIAGKGLPDKSVNISALDIEDQDGSKIDLTGGGDLYAYRWLTGLGGSNDILNPSTTSSFAVIPGYQADYAPFAPYNGIQTKSGPKNLLLDANNVLTDHGYVSLKPDGSPALSVGDQVYLGASNGLPAGNYTLLPARYALLPHGFLVTPQRGIPTETVLRPDGSSLVSGYKFNNLSAARPLFSSFEVDPQSVVTSRAEYDPFSANSFLSQSALAQNLAIPRLPVDSGQLVLNATTKLALAPGGLVATPPVGGRGSLVDITSASDISIVSPNATTQPSQGNLVLDSKNLSQFGAESLLVGGTRQTTTKGTIVTVTTKDLTVDNTGEPLTGPDVILVANNNLELRPGADVEQGAGTLSSPADALQVGQNKVLGGNGNDKTFTVSRAGVAISFPNGMPVGDTISSRVDATVTTADGKTTTALPAGTSFSVPVGGSLKLNGIGSFTFFSNNADHQVSFVIGDGTLLRVSSDAAASIARAGVTGATSPSMTIGAGAKIGNTVAVGSVTLDSTDSTFLYSTGLSAKAINLDSGQISLQLPDHPGSLWSTNGQTTAGLVLSSGLFDSLEGSAKSLSLLSYSSIDIYGSNEGAPASTIASLALHAGEIRGFNTGGGTATFSAQNILLDNSANGTAPGQVVAQEGALDFNAGAGPIELGANQLAIDQYKSVTLLADGGITVQGTGGLTTEGSLAMQTPLLTGATGAHETITAGAAPTPAAILLGLNTTQGSLSIANADGSPLPVPPPTTPSYLNYLGANLTLIGATNGVTNTTIDNGVTTIATDGVTIDSNITLHSGTLNIEADQGNLAVYKDGKLDVSGTEKDFFDKKEYTSGGQITLTSDTGGVSLAAGSVVDVSAQPAAGNAGSLAISAPNIVPGTTYGTFIPGGILSGKGGIGGQGGTFSLDIGTLGGVGGNLDSLGKSLFDAGFIQSVSIRDRGDFDSSSSSAVTLNGTLTAHTVNLSADQGSITVTGTGMIDASGATGGTINLEAHDNVTLSSGSSLTVKGDHYNNAGKGGSISLSAGNYTYSNGNPSFNQTAKVDIQSGAQLNLDVTNRFTPQDIAAVSPGQTPPDDNRADFFTGTLLLSEPQFAFGDGTALLTALGNDISNINNASNIVLAGLHVFDLSGTGGGATIQNHSLTSYFGSSDIIDNVETDVMAYGQNFVNPVYINAGNLNTLNFRNKARNLLINVEPSAEIVNNNPGNNAGNLELDSIWDLSTSRFGPNSTPGILTLRAAGNVIFGPEASLSDGFGDGIAPASSPTALWQAPLLLPGSQSWTYNLVAGADVTAADSRRLQPLATLLAANTPTGSLLLGNGSLGLSSNPLPISRSAIIPQFYQVIRTGTGDINISAGLDVQFLNPLAAIYTAGTAVSNPLNLVSPAGSASDFDPPDLANRGNKNSTIGPPQGPIYPAQYSLNGGNITIFAQDDIVRTTVDSNGNVIPDSSKEMPTNWLYRRGYVLNGSGNPFGPIPTQVNQSNPQIGSTSWWVDFSNFFEDVGALGGGNVTLTAGRDVSNVDAVVPTNARMTKQLPNGDLVAADQTLVELGGGDLAVRAGRNIDGGVYYVERGQGTLSAGNEILTNATRATVPANTVNPDPTTWLPTTLFLGKGSFDVSAGGSVLLGSVANPFLLPQGINNSFLLRTFFSTFTSNDSVNVSSLAGDATFKKEGATYDGSLAGWYANIMSYYTDGTSLASKSQPWLRLTEVSTAVADYAPAASLLPGTLKATAFSDSINLVNGLTLLPSATGTLDLVAAQSINGLQPAILNGTSYQWNPSTITLSDADPTTIPGVLSPVAVPSKVTATKPADLPAGGPMPTVTNLTTDTGATSGPSATLQAEQALHASIKDSAGVSGPLHANDTTGPVHLYAENGDISGLTLFSAKSAQVSAGNDITDVGLYVQNVNAKDLSVVSAGRDIIAYDSNSTLVGAAKLQGDSRGGDPMTGDIQISGPGTLEVLAGRDLTLGNSGTNAVIPDGTLTGVTSVGNARNPALPFTGANVVAGAGIGVSTGLDKSKLDFSAFIGQFLTPASSYWQNLLPDLQALLPSPISVTGDQLHFSAGLPAIWPELTESEQQLLAPQILNTFYLILRDAGRDFNDPSSPSFKNNYNHGFAAIAALFPDHAWQGDISLTSREIKTENGGDISIFAPGGQLTVGLPVAVDRPADQGILTAHGGNISIFANSSVNVGFSRIFTLRGGNEIIWSSTGNIDAGSASKTVQAAPPTRVLVDPQSANVTPDLSGLATGGGIGVLETVVGVPPANIDLIAPVGTIDAGDAGIRASGHLNIAAAQVLNASNIQAANTTTSAPPPPAAPNIAGIASASNSTSASTSAAAQVAKQGHAPVQQQEFPSIITVEVLGYGGGDS